MTRQDQAQDSVSAARRHVAKAPQLLGLAEQLALAERGQEPKVGGSTVHGVFLLFTSPYGRSDELE
jgi:hypothetical protein